MVSSGHEGKAQEAHEMLSKCEPDQLLAFAYFLGCKNPKQLLANNRSNLIDECVDRVIKNSRGFSTFIKIVNNVTGLRLLDSVTDTNALRICFIIQSIFNDPYFLGNKNKPIKISETFPMDTYGRSELFTEVCLTIFDNPVLTKDDIEELDSIFRKQWYPIVSKDELKLRDSSKGNMKLFLEELNIHLQKETRDTAPHCNNWSELLIQMDYQFGHSVAERKLFIDAVKKTHANKKNRNKNNSKQKNFAMNLVTEKNLKELARVYQMSETEVVCTLINSEKKTPYHLDELKKWRDEVRKRSEGSSK